MINDFLELDLQIARNMISGSMKLQIVRNPKLAFPTVYHIKDETYETISLPEVYQVSKHSTMEVLNIAADVLDLGEATVFDESDIILTQSGAVWDKSYTPLFSKSVPRDFNLIGYEDKFIYIKPKMKQKRISGKCISLLGVHEKIWSHFIVQFFPKLYYAKCAGLLTEKTTLLLPEYDDEHIKRVVDDFLAQFHPNIIVAEKEIAYICEQLYYIPTVTALPNHLYYMIPQDIVVPQIVTDAIKKCLVERYITEGTVDPTKEYPTKIYLIRRDRARTIKNWKEIESYFVSEGFQLIEPRKLDFDEKVQLFHNADIIVSPLSSALFNLLWCKPGAKVLVFSNYPRIVEPDIIALTDIANARVLYLTGEDCDKNNVHASYYIPLPKIKESYLYLLNCNDD